MVTMDAYEYHQGNNPGNNEQYISTDDDEDLDRKDILMDAGSGYDPGYDYASYGLQQQQQQLQEQQPSTSSSNHHHQPFYGAAAPYMMPSSSSDIKPIITDIPPLVPPMYLQTSRCFSYNNDYQSYASPNSSSGNPFHQSYPFYKPWYNQVKSEQMANILNR